MNLLYCAGSSGLWSRFFAISYLKDSFRVRPFYRLALSIRQLLLLLHRHKGQKARDRGNARHKCDQLRRYSRQASPLDSQHFLEMITPSLTAALIAQSAKRVAQSKGGETAHEMRLFPRDS